VFMSKTDSIFISRFREKLIWLFGGDSKLVTGIVIWIFLICILIVIKRIYNDSYNYGKV